MTPRSLDNDRPAEAPDASNAGDAARPPPRRPLKFALRAAAAIVLLTWFGHYAYVRIVTLAAGPEVNRLAEPEAEAAALDAASTALAAALAAIPPLSPFDEPAPEGMHWDRTDLRAPPVNLYDVVNGPWDPATRPNLRVVVRYLATPAMTAAIDEVRKHHNGPFRTAMNTTAWYMPRPAVPYTPLRDCTNVLVARARYRHAGLGDTTGAWDDLKTALSMIEATRKTFLVDLMFEVRFDRQILEELCRMSLEADLPEDVANDIQVTLEHRRELALSWSQVIRNHLTSDEDDLTAFFSDSNQGRGWLVLSDQPLLSRLTPGGGIRSNTNNRSRLWNIGAAVFNDRQTSRSKLAAEWVPLENLMNLSYRDAITYLERYTHDAPRINALDGLASVLLHYGDEPTSVIRDYRFALLGTAHQRAARVMITLNRFRAHNGRHPDNLDELVPDFLEALPLDPFCGRPFGYRCEGSGGYVLYSCGFDGDDDRGNPGGAAEGEQNGGGESWDRVFTLERQRPSAEPVPLPDDTDSHGG